MALHDPTQWPAVSVVVPVYNGEHQVADCVRALRAQDYLGLASVEILVVDNGSSDGTRTCLSGFEPGIRVISEPQRGASWARNAGIRAAEHELIAFTDADCIPQPHWLSELVAYSQANPGADLVGGPIRARPPLTELARFVDTLFDQHAALQVYRPPYVISANLLARRPLLESVGMFNPEFPRSQDVELSFRAGLRHGARFGYAEQAEVRHVHVDSLRELYRKGLQHGSGAAHIRREFLPELGPPKPRPDERAPLRGLLRAAARLGWSQLTRTGVAAARQAFYAALFRLGRRRGFVRAQRALESRS